MREPRILPKIAIFTLDNVKFNLETFDDNNFVATELELHYFNCDIDTKILNKFDYIVLVDTAKSWVYIPPSLKNVLYVEKAIDISADLIYNEYIKYILKDYNPTISIFTPTFNSFEKINRVYLSLLEQSFQDWEWIILDDSTNKNNISYIKNLSKNDNRVKIFDYINGSGFIGQTKRFAASLCNGDYFFELDHDDVLHHLAFEKVVGAFKKFPDAKFAFCSSAEYFDDGRNVDYGSNFAMGYGKHYDLWYKGRCYRPSIAPVNFATMRHIVGVPNHFRCWEKNFYFSLHRHNDKLNIVDDYELLIRTFLNTRMIRILDCLYFQTTDPNSATNPRRKEIQRKVDRISKFYNEKIHERILELNGIDFPLTDKPAQHYNLSYDY